MIDVSEVQTYLIISKKNFVIYLFDKKKLKTLYYEKLDLENKINDLDLESLNNFLNENIFKIEKLIGNFIKNIFIYLETEDIFNINISLKKKSYEKKLQVNFLENLLVEAKDLIQENYDKYKITHMVINKYIINGKIYTNFINNQDTDNLGLEINFKCFHKNLLLQITHILDKYHIEIDRFLDLKYVNSSFPDENIDPVIRCYKVLDGFNQNEINLEPKNIKKIGFFEKFFQLFS
ncbi:hypothetical protein [Candidatus Pelagibacter sp. HIMB1709]|uniref:hypothetical protein n=2 Tax=unclassified Candidatus Pelagibacter TaxID=2647897 RepID=UPI003F857EF2